MLNELKCSAWALLELSLASQTFARKTGARCAAESLEKLEILQMLSIGFYQAKTLLKKTM